MLLEDTLPIWLQAASRRDFTLVVAGRTSGIFRGAVTHRPYALRVIGRNLILEFEDAGILTITDPSGIRVGPNGGLLVRNAREVRFAMDGPGPPNEARRACEELFQRVGPVVHFRRRGEDFTTATMLGYVGDEFVALR